MRLSKSILAFDPGDHTGWCFRDRNGSLTGGTKVRCHSDVANLILDLKPDIVVLESFKLYPSKAQSLAWNSFYPCEVIGVIKYVCESRGIPWIEQAPSVKKYAGDCKEGWDLLRSSSDTFMEHTKDAYQHLRYFERNGLKKFK